MIIEHRHFITLAVHHEGVIITARRPGALNLEEKQSGRRCCRRWCCRQGGGIRAFEPAATFSRRSACGGVAGSGVRYQ